MNKENQNSFKTFSQAGIYLIQRKITNTLKFVGFNAIINLRNISHWDPIQIKPPNSMKLWIFTWLYRKAWSKISLIKISSDKGNRSHFSAKIWSIKLSIKWKETSIHYVICSLFDRVNKMYRSSAMASLSSFEITYIIHMTLKNTFKRNAFQIHLSTVCDAFHGCKMCFGNFNTRNGL